MSTSSETKSNSDNPTTSGETEQAEKVEVKWLHPDGKPNMEDEKSNEPICDNPQQSDDKGSSSTGASSWSAWGASAWSAWGKVENIAKTAAYQAGDVAKTAAYSAAYSAGPEDTENSEEEKLQVESDGSVKELPNEQKKEQSKDNESDKGEGSPSKENKSVFSNSPSIASISSLTGKSVGGFFSGLSSYVEENKEWVKSVAADATAAIKENVKVPPIDLQQISLPVPDMLSEFNKEQQEFIKTKGDVDSGVVTKPQEGLAPWIGYQEEDAMKAKILSLSCDRRTFVRAPPSGVTFDFDYASVSSTALALLKEDPKLSEMRYEFVPKVVKEDEFWKNYFYRVNLIKQSFDLKDLEDQSPHHGKSSNDKDSVESRLAPAEDGLDDDNAGSVHSHDADDEFVSESFQGATKKEMAEVNESMRRLGLGGGGDDDAGVEEWEAELEGELNEFEVVSSKDGNEDPTDDMTETEIQEMLDAEDGTSSTDSLKRK